MEEIHTGNTNVQRQENIFLNGEILFNSKNGDYLIYNIEERDSWEVIIVLPGVEIIPGWALNGCMNVETVIMADSVKRIERDAFAQCFELKLVNCSRNLEFIGYSAFWSCESLISIFIPPSCIEIGRRAFCNCPKLIIFSIPRNIQVGEGVFQRTALIKNSPFELYGDGYYDLDDDDEAIQWVKSINNEEAYALHHACSSFNPLPEIIHALVKRQGIEGMRMKNKIGITPSQYLAANTFTDISEKDIINRYISDIMGEVF